MGEQLLLIGWDGADWKIINELIGKGLMPNLANLIKQGSYGKIASLDPPYSPMLWTSIATGKRAYKHGVLGFQELSPDRLSVRPVLSSSRQCRAIWNMLSQNHLKTHMVAWWPSHPAEAINGVAISNFFHQASHHTPTSWPFFPKAVHPPELASYYSQFRIHPNELTVAHLAPFFPSLEKMQRHYGKAIQQVRTILAEMASIQALITNIIRTKPWNFASAYFDGIDRICHEFMAFHPPKQDHIPQHEYDLFHEIVTGIYRFHDMMLGSIINLVGEKAHIIIISDHGFKSDQLRPRHISYEPAGIAYEHSNHGIFVAKGKNIKANHPIYGASLLDITPTILHFFSLPIGRDMDGIPLLSIFENPKDPIYIESWEPATAKMSYSESPFAVHPTELQQMTQQLVDLGYVEVLNEDPELAIQKTQQFCDTNLARAYFDGGKIEEACDLFEKIYRTSPKIPWIGFRLAVCYQALARNEACRSILLELQASQFYQQYLIETMQASLLIGEGQYQAALEILDKIDIPDAGNQAIIHLQVAQCYFKLGQQEKAKKWIDRSLAIDSDFAAAHQLLGIWYFNQQAYEEALDHLFSAVGLQEDLNAGHYYIGRSLLALGQYEAGANALELALKLAPHNNHARELLAYTYKTHLDQPVAAAEVLQSYINHLKGTLIIVSGLPRSGTSMLMQMLDAGGIPLFTDKIRKADESNPKGYYEHEAVKKIAYNHYWLSTVKGRAVKIVAPLITHLPYQYRYKVIFMIRPLMEVYNSQMKMLERKDKPIDTFSLEFLNTLQHYLDETKKWMSRHPSVEVLFVPYTEVLNAPLEWSVKIAHFLQDQLDPLAMSTIVDPALKRENSMTKN